MNLGFVFPSQKVRPFPANRSSLDNGKPEAILGRKVTDPLWMAGLPKERFSIYLSKGVHPEVVFLSIALIYAAC